MFTMFPAGNGGTVELVYMQVRVLLFTFFSGTLGPFVIFVCVPNISMNCQILPQASP